MAFKPTTLFYVIDHCPRLNNWYLFPKNVDVEKLTKFYKSMHINVLSKILLSLQLFWIFGRSFTPFLAIYSARIMTNLEETKMLKRCKYWFKMFPSLTKYSPASQNVPKPSLHLEL